LLLSHLSPSPHTHFINNEIHNEHDSISHYSGHQTTRFFHTYE
jgi:hypothetical protein